MATFGALAGLAAFALVPPFLMALWMRARERFGREPLGVVVLAFVYGGTIGILAAFILNRTLGTAAHAYAGFAVTAAFLTAVLVAPFIEEAVKLVGFGLVQKHCNEPEDTVVYGAAIGLGFAATENLIYAWNALDAGTGWAFFSVGLRLMSSTVLHGASTALVGIGIGLAVFWKRNIFGVLPFYIAAVVLHMVYNYLVSLGAVTRSVMVQFGGLVFAIATVWAVILVMRWRIKELDEERISAEAIADQDL